MDFFSLRISKWIPLALCFITLTTAHAAERLSLRHLSFSELQHLTQVALPDKSQNAPISALHSLVFLQQHTDKNQVEHIRMQQKYAGFPVFGGDAILHRYAGKVLSMSGAIYRNLQDDLGQPNPKFQQNGQVVLAHFTQKYSGHITEQKVKPLVFINEQHHAIWAYQVSLLIQPTNDIPYRPTAIIDAQTGTTLKQWNDVKTVRTIEKGVGFGGNQKTGTYQYGDQLPLLTISRDDFYGLCYMENHEIRVIDMAYQYEKPNAPMSFECPTPRQDNAYWTGYGQDGYDFQNGAYSPSNDALYIGGMIKQMYKKEYGVEALMDRRKPKQLIMRVHYGKSYTNAFWDGSQMTFGDGDSNFFPLVSLGIGAHEVSHGFTEQHAALIYSGESGAINESFSDMAAQAAEYYVHHTCSWRIGTEILKANAPYVALRYMDKPSRDGFSIDTASQYRKGIDVHYSSGVYNRLFYLLSHRPNWNPSQAFRVMIKANMDYWTPTTTFEDGACGILHATEDLGLSVDDVTKALDDVMIYYYDC